MGINRREFLIGCSGITAGIVGASSIISGGVFVSRYIEAKDKEQSLDLTLEWFKNNATATAQNVKIIEGRGLTPTPAAKVVADIVTQNPTEFPTFITAPVLIETPSLVPSSTESAREQREKLMLNRETAYDAARSLPPVVTVNAIGLWMTRISTDVVVGVVNQNELSAYEQLVEVSGGTLENPDLKFLGSANLTESAAKNSLDAQQAWVYSRSKENEDKEFPKAYESKQVLKDQVANILRTAWKTEPTTKEVDSYYNTLVSQLFTIKEGVKVEDTVLVTRNSYRAHNDGVRKDQPQFDICSIYESQVEIGKEYKDEKTGILHLSNKAPFQFTAVWSRTPITNIDDPNRGADLIVRSKDGKKVEGYVFMRVQDQGSLPKDAILGVQGVPEPVVGETGPWMSVVDTSCGPSKPVVKKENKPNVQQAQPNKPQQEATPKLGETPKPPENTQVVQPSVTQARTQPPQPTRTPGGSGATPIVDTPVDTPAPVATSIPQNTVPPVLPTSVSG